MKRSLLFIGTVLLACSIHAQLANTTWDLALFGTPVSAMQFGDDGIMYILQNGQQFVAEATYTDIGDIFTVTGLPGNDCTQTGIYTYEITDSELQFTLVEDVCPGRPDVFIQLTWTSTTIVIADHSISHAAIYPNPSDGTIHIQHDVDGGSTIRILDMNGRPFYSTRTLDHHTEWDISQLPSGTYLLELITIEGRELRKLMLD